MIILTEYTFIALVFRGASLAGDFWLTQGEQAKLAYSPRNLHLLLAGALQCSEPLPLPASGLGTSRRDVLLCCCESCFLEPVCRPPRSFCTYTCTGGACAGAALRLGGSAGTLARHWTGRWSGKSPPAGNSTGCFGTDSGCSLPLPCWGCTSAEHSATCLWRWTWSGCHSGGGVRAAERSRSPVRALGVARSTAQKEICR